MHNMRFSGNEPLSVIIRQTKKFKKLKRNYPKCKKKLKPEGMR